jgi:hypothetical protein
MTTTASELSQLWGNDRRRKVTRRRYELRNKVGETRTGAEEMVNGKYALRKILIKVKKLKMKSSLALLTILN